jgi:hypothetical protein
MLFLVAWLFNSIFSNGRMMNWEVCGMELWHISRLISGTGGNYVGLRVIWWPG